MFDDKSNRMKDDLIDAKKRIRMQTTFAHQHEFKGCMQNRLIQCNEYFENYAFININENHNT